MFLATLHSMLDLSSPARDWTHAPCVGRAESYPLDHQESRCCIACAGCHHEERGSRDDQAKFPLSGVPDPTPIASAPVTLSQPRMCDLCFWQNEMFNHLGMFRLVCVQSLSFVRLFVPLWTVARQSPLTVGFSRQEYWSELPFPPPGNRPNPGIEPPAPAL